MGWFVIGITVINIVVNTILGIGLTIRFILKALKKWWRKPHQKAKLHD
jgi:hypothetical protein